MLLFVLLDYHCSKLVELRFALLLELIVIGLIESYQLAEYAVYSAVIEDQLFKIKKLIRIEKQKVAHINEDKVAN
ncbi:MAG: hypothetical protein EZS28_044057 [Streblomastix strix]|uniref:Uncharacterized protein n=1 Tax=Streblomastix strix TaxID=222440 RepID=A0A5J4TPN1_9EUKA|nr:MAG: hypothetical protein EZS28_044057 [Streblomastix strix]